MANSSAKKPENQPDPKPRTQACQRHEVLSLDVFGSAAGDGFYSARSDIDLIVKFSDRAGPALFEHYFDLTQQLEAVFSRPVDLVMEGALRNPPPFHPGHEPHA